MRIINNYGNQNITFRTCVKKYKQRQIHFAFRRLIGNPN